jgi:formylglycine-generating enzyme required for sulfatase activity/energy-coupling factor transporter ATP-binding protein EcfA2
VTDEKLSAIEQLKRALDAGLIDQGTYETAVIALSAQDAEGAVAQGQGASAVGKGGIAVDGDHAGDINTGRNISAAEGAQIVYAEEGATVVIGEAPVTMSAVDRKSALGRYLQHLISQNRYLQLQGIRSGGKLVNIELDRIYITLRTTRQRSERDQAAWLETEQLLAPGERHRGLLEAPADTMHITVNDALADHRRLVVLGDPGSGKTTLLRYLSLLYARDQADATHTLTEQLGLPESGTLPIFLPLRQIGRYLAEHHGRDDGTDGHGLLLQFLVQILKNERIVVPADFFDRWLRDGRAAVLLDGLDEVADPGLRRRVARLVDAFTRAYPGCRYLITSRIVGYTDTCQLTEGYATTTVRDFTLDDVQAFLSQWHRLVAIGQMGPGPTAEAAATAQTRQLLEAIGNNDRVRELAINPLLLTVIALVHRDRVKLPDRRAELYAEAVDVLLGKWDEARGVQESMVLNDRPFDLSDRRLVLQQVAFAMHEDRLKEIDAEPLRQLLRHQLSDVVTDPRDLEPAVARFLSVIQERTGLLIARAEGTYAFSHLTFQEYLAALHVAGGDDYVRYTLGRSADAWWREVILLEAGYLGTQNKERTTRLIRAIADAKQEPALYHNLVLAAECVRDAGASRIVGNLENELRRRIQDELEKPAARGPLASLRTLFTRGMTAQAAATRRIAAAEALGKIGGNRFWSLPHGEPEWVTIAAGAFTMGEADQAHRVHLPEYAIARVPITNAQYQLFVEAAGHEPPPLWPGKRAPRGKESHPVVGANWHDARTYCQWLSQAIGQSVTLPSEAEWEKAARGADDARAYPWGDDFDAARCNDSESGFGDTTPVGVFLNGASPYGCLDLAGNVWEWTDERGVRGGSWHNRRGYARCASRGRLQPGDRLSIIGFRVVLRRSPVASL